MTFALDNGELVWRNSLEKLARRSDWIAMALDWARIRQVYLFKLQLQIHMQIHSTKRQLGRS